MASQFWHKGKGKLCCYCKLCHASTARKSDAIRKAKDPDKEKRRQAATVRRWRAKHKEKLRPRWREEMRKRYQNSPAHRAAVKARNRRYTANNKERLAAAGRAYRLTANGKQVVRRCSLRRKARVKSVTAPDAEAAVALILQKKTHKCMYCGKRVSRFHIEHIIPLSKGGTHSASNIGVACPACNLRKGPKLPNQFIEKGQLIML